MKNSKKGFTLIELMIVVAIIGILAAIAIPKFADLINKSKEGATKGALSSVRSAINVYYGDNEGWYPSGAVAAASTDNNLVVALTPKYINEIPQAKLPGTGHADNAQVAFTSTTVTDGAGWAYNGNSFDNVRWGQFVVSCTHMDLKQSTVWSSF
ncbi:MAG TPA: prepilin-type N-terminal cleavage/methylation domain-containing protein [Elusimicrobiales bacterium]|nr:prepilin-type N-terminal cleavage/methylation domain-containing protein [Elusimicrobiales bacterium]